MSKTMSWAERDARAFDRYCDQLARGLHDDNCEQRERSRLCHCSKRRREAEGQTTLPELIWRSPSCSGCSGDLNHDGDSWTCPRCKVTWASDANDGDQAESFTDDYGDDLGGEQFGERLIVKASQ